MIIVINVSLKKVLSVFVLFSDEELEDHKALLYLPIAPEVEDPEENPFGPPPDASVQSGAPEDTLTGGDKKQRQPSSEGGPAKKKARTTTIELQGVPSDGEREEINCWWLRLQKENFTSFQEVIKWPFVFALLRGTPLTGCKRGRQVKEEDSRPAQRLQR